MRKFRRGPLTLAAFLFAVGTLLGAGPGGVEALRRGPPPLRLGPGTKSSAGGPPASLASGGAAAAAKSPKIVAAAKAQGQAQAAGAAAAAAAAAGGGDDAAFWRLAVLALTVVWSTNFAFIRSIFVSLPDLDASIYASVRFGIAALVLLPTYVNALGNAKLVRDSALCAAFVMLGYWGQSLGLKFGSSADKSAFLSSLVVVWVAVAPALLNGTAKIFGLVSPLVPPARALNVGAVVLAVTGIALLELDGSSPPTLGDAYSLLQPVGFGTSYFFIERQMRNPDNVANPEAPRQATGLRVFCIALLSLLWAGFEGNLSVVNIVHVTESPTALAALVYLGCVTTAGGLWLQTLAFRRVSASDASMILSSEPVWAALFAMALLGESVSLTEAVGGGMIISACLANELLGIDKRVSSE